MFSMPGHETERNMAAPEGASDEKPIVLHGETAEKFRVLLSVIYAL